MCLRLSNRVKLVISVTRPTEPQGDLEGPGHGTQSTSPKARQLSGRAPGIYPVGSNPGLITETIVNHRWNIC